MSRANQANGLLQFLRRLALPDIIRQTRQMNSTTVCVVILVILKYSLCFRFAVYRPKLFSELGRFTRGCYAPICVDIHMQKQVPSFLACVHQQCLIRLLVSGTPYGVGSGTHKHQARNAAARRALTALRSADNQA